MNALISMCIVSLGPPGLDEQIEACDGSVEKTQALLEPLITRPKLSAKLLGKPPFRFLHDVISEIIRKTGFAAGLYANTELDSAAVTDKAAKIRYLAKIIKLIGMQLNTFVEARPAKIVSGLEPENTNRLLQLLAVAAALAPNSEQAVQAVLASDDFAGDVSLAGAAAKDDALDLNTSKEVAKPPPLQQDNEADLSFVKAENAKEESATDDSAAPQSKRSTRPRTARRRPPKYKEKKGEDDVSVAKETPAATIMVDGDECDDDEFGMGTDLKGDQADSTVGHITEGKSKLVREIQEEERLAKKSGETKTVSGGIRFGRIDHGVGGTKGEKFLESDLNELQSAIQALCQSTNPLGKCMDYIHEDLATMNKEFERWQHEYRIHAEALEAEQHISTELMQPLHLQLKELDEKISDEQKCMRSVKARILKQEGRILELLRMVCTTVSR